MKTFAEVGGRVSPNDVVFVSNRSKLLLHEELYRTAFAKVCNGAPEQPVPPDLPAAYRDDLRVRRMVEGGLQTGVFRDSYWTARWTHMLNDRLPKGLPRLLCVGVHAETEIDRLFEEIVVRGHRPAGVVFSGSSKMLSSTLEQDTAVMKTIHLARELLYCGVPVTGYCFGFHVLLYACYGPNALVRWLMVPDGVTHEVVLTPQGERDMQATPGKRRAIVGSFPLTVERSSILFDPSEDGLPCLQYHAQYLPFPHPVVPSQDVLATSSRVFRLPNGAIQREGVVEAVEFGPVAHGFQFHPELTPEILLGACYLPSFQQTLRRDELDVPLTLDMFWNHPREERGGWRFGWRWMERVLLLHYRSVGKFSFDASGG